MKTTDLKGATILAIDDNPTNLETLSDYLTQFGFTVLLKSDGEKAFALLKRRLPDLILLDIVMPGIDGFEICRRLKEDPDTKDIPVIFMSALSDTVDKVTGFELGAVDYITKPFQYKEVLARVNAHLTIQHLQKDLQTKNVELQSLLERERRSLERERKLIEDLRLNLSISLPHELRTPLNNILGFAQLLIRARSLPKPDSILEYANGIYRAGLRLHRLVENSLLYANLKLLKYTPKERLSWQSDALVHAKDFITPVAKNTAKAFERQHDLVLELVNTNIRISPNNFEKILIELLDNAFKFSQTGTPVQIKTTVNGHLCILSITDQGRGMAEEQVANIGAYMQFGRRSYEQQGSGLGLVIASLLAQLEGGVLSINSTLHQGTTVSIVLNCESPEGKHAEEDDRWWFDADRAALVQWFENEVIIGYTPADQSKETRVLKILVVTDVQENRSVLVELLSSVGFDVIESDNHNGLDTALDYHPHIMFIEGVALESADQETVRQIQRQFTKLIVISDKASYPIYQHHLVGLYSDIFVKPVSIQEIFDALEVYLRIEWTYRDGCQTPQFHVPSKDDLNRLYELAVAVDLKPMLDYVDNLEQSDEQYAPFAAKIRQLAGGYQFDLIQRFISKYLENA